MARLRGGSHSPRGTISFEAGRVGACTGAGATAGDAATARAVARRGGSWRAGGVAVARRLPWRDGARSGAAAHAPAAAPAVGAAGSG